MSLPMFASSSKTVFRMSTSIIQSQAFSTSARSAAITRRVMVELLRDVEGLGQTNDRILVQPGRARHYLVPNREARLVPFVKRVKYAPMRYSVRLAADRAGRSQASLDPSTLLAPPKRDTSPELTRSEEREVKLSELLLALPPSFAFPLRTIAPDQKAVHGSVTLADISNKLALEHRLPPLDVQVSWDEKPNDARMKELGKWNAFVAIRGGSERRVPIVIEVVRLVEDDAPRLVGR